MKKPNRNFSLFPNFPVSGSNHYGIAGHYAMLALKENMIVSKLIF